MRSVSDKLHSSSFSWIYTAVILIVALTVPPVPGYCDGETGEELYWRNFNGIKYIKNYSPGTYNSLSQNWAITQDRRGILYVANNGGILQYDGISWRLIRLTPVQAVRSLDIDKKTGYIYVGARPDIGYLAPGIKGEMKYHSLLPHLDKKWRDFNRVFQVVCTPAGVWFRTNHGLLLWSGSKFSGWTHEQTGGAVWTLFKWNNSVIAQIKGYGFIRLADESGLARGPVQLMPGSKILSYSKINMAFPYDSRHLLLGTAYAGFYLYDGSKAVSFKSQADGQFKSGNMLYHGIQLENGYIMLAFPNSCLLVMDREGRIKERFDLSYGLQNNNYKHVFQDKGGNIWLALEKGITRIDYSSPFSFFDERTGLEGLVMSVARHDGRLWAGTTRGLYLLESPQKNAMPRFREVKKVGDYCRGLLSHGNTLLAAPRQGVYAIAPGEAPKAVGPPGCHTLLTSQTRPDRIWAGSSGFFVALNNQNGKWREEFRSKNLGVVINSIVEYDGGKLWMGSLNGKVLKVEFPGSMPVNTPLDIPKITLYGAEHGIPPGETYVVRAARKLLLCTSKGFYRFRPGTGVFVPDDFLGDIWAGNKTNVFRLVEDRNRGLWFHSARRNYHAVHTVNGPYTVESTPFLRLPKTQVNSIFIEHPMVWFASEDGLIGYNTATTKHYDQPYHALVRNVTISGGESVYYGDVPPDHQPNPILRYPQKNIKLSVAATFFDKEDDNRFRYYLEGYNTRWSDWSRETDIDFTNLSAGNYRFRVQARNIFEIESIEDSFSFRVLPPWFLTWWAFLVYSAAAATLVLLIVKWRSHKLLKEKQQLESLIQERTREIYQTNLRLEEKTHLLEEQSEKLKEMDKTKSRFFANISHEFRTPLTLIMGPLDGIRSQCQDIKLKEQINLVDRNAGRLLNLINQLLDLSQFESGKMKLQARNGDIVSFFRSIIEPFRVVAEEHGLEMTFHSPYPSILLYFDPEKLEKVMANLLSNAVKFTPSGGNIRITVACVSHRDESVEPHYGDGGSVLVAVKDSGTGIPREQLVHIFDRFYQAESTVEHFRKGSGIGLALVKEMMDLHHAELTAHSTPGKGTEFIMRFPMGRSHFESGEILETGETLPPAASSEIAESLKDMQTAVNRDNEPSETGIAENGTPCFNTETKAEKNIVLVVEDNADLRSYIRGALEPEFTVEEAGDGVSGVEKAMELIPDLIISDIMMPRKDGYELCKEIKNNVSTSHIPVIMLTARVSEESVIQGLETGADDYITKPFNSRVLSVRIKNLIELRRQFQMSIKREMVLQPSHMGLSKIDKEFMEDLQKVIEKNITDPDFNVEQLSKKLYVSRVTLYRKIQALSGETPTDFIRSYRLKRAATLLRNNFGSVTEVAFEVGFNSRAYFTKCFKEKFHQLPSEYLSTKTA